MVPTVEQLCGNITFKQDFNSTAHFNSHNMNFTLLESVITISNEQCFYILAYAWHMVVALCMFDD